MSATSCARTVPPVLISRDFPKLKACSDDCVHTSNTYSRFLTDLFNREATITFNQLANSCNVGRGDAGARSSSMSQIFDFFTTSCEFGTPKLHWDFERVSSPNCTVYTHSIPNFCLANTFVCQNFIMMRCATDG